MSFETEEGQTRSGSGITLYRFQVDLHKFYRYTDDDKDYVWGDETFEAVPISGADFGAGTLLDRQPYEISMPKGVGLAQYLKQYPPSYVMRAEVFLVHPESDLEERRRVWVGKIAGIATKGSEAVIVCDTSDSSFKGPGLRRTYQRQCPHALYGPQCRAAKVSLDLVVMPLTAGINTLALAALPPEVDPAHYLGGTAEWTTDEGKVIRNIIGAYRDGTSLRLSLAGPADTAVIGEPISIFKGCERTENSCTVRFNNILNYGGQPWIPLENPLQTVSTFL